MFSFTFRDDFPKNDNEIYENKSSHTPSSIHVISSNIASKLETIPIGIVPICFKSSKRLAFKSSYKKITINVHKRNQISILIRTGKIAFPLKVTDMRTDICNCKDRK